MGRLGWRLTRKEDDLFVQGVGGRAYRGSLAVEAKGRE